MQLGILHRDLKPANILNNKKNWKIADFGFAIYSEGDIKTRYNVGTPLYMPPEALVKNIYSPLSDIFSIGVIFY
jgi:serine/threonine protein kinase